MLPGREVVGLGELGDRLRDERQRCAQVVRHVREEHQFGPGGLLELFVQLFLLVALRLEEPVLVQELLLMPSVLPVGAEQQESDAA